MGHRAFLSQLEVPRPGFGPCLHHSHTASLCVWSRAGSGFSLLVPRLRNQHLSKGLPPSAASPSASHHGLTPSLTHQRSTGRVLPVIVFRRLHSSPCLCFSVAEIQVGPRLDHRTLILQSFPYYPKIIPMGVKNFSFTKTDKGNKTPRKKKALYVAGKFPEAEIFPCSSCRPYLQPPPSAG